jgi:lysophospholipase L1-like esterase
MSRFKRAAAAVGAGWSIVGIALALLLLIEGSLHLIPYVMDRAGWSPDPPIAELWGKKLYADEKGADFVRWEPYVYWRRRPYAGDLIQVDAEGVRRTWSGLPKGSFPNTRKTRIFFFGGSTLWGSGASDEETIPSWCIRMLTEKGYAVEGVNFGEGGYVSTQGLIYLLRQLQKGNNPNLVVFYDGFNDMGSAFMNEAAGLPANEENRRQEFNLVNRSTLSKSFPLLLRSMNLYKLLHGEPTLRNEDYQRKLGIYTSGGVLDALRVYLVNVRTVEAMGKAFGFEPFFFWQPTVFTKAKRTPYEDDFVMKNPIMAKVQTDAISLIARAPELARHPKFKDVSDALGDHADQTFFDECHVNGKGNELIARKIVAALLPTFEERARNAPPP